MTSTTHRPAPRAPGAALLAEDPAATAAAFDHDGFAVARQVLDADEVARLRADVAASLATRRTHFALGHALPNAAIEAPRTRWVLHHPGVVGAVKRCLGADELQFTMEAGAHRNATSAWHKDTGEHAMEGGYYGCEPFGRTDCRVVKVGVYLQDHRDGTGLRVRERSHTTARLDVGREIVLDIGAGDAVLFDVRITHMGEAPSALDRALLRAARVLPAARRADAVALARRGSLRALGRPQRLAMFFAYGPVGGPTVDYGHRNLARQLEQTGRPLRDLDPQLEAALARVGVRALPPVAVPAGPEVHR